jgi:N-acetylmuramic acid 6-phosphate etherase
MKSRGELKTEQQNPQSSQIDSMSINGILKTINREDQNIAIAVQATIRDIEKTVELTVNSIRKGGRVFYVGAGTSGRLGVLDASEIPPTFSAPKVLFIGVIAGGENALRNSVEGAEDRPEDAIIDLEQYELNKNDTLVGISCSGAATYVVSALDHAKANGAKTVYLVTNPNPYKVTEVDVIINAVTGPEVVTGSTRMKAGTATKLILNMISTATMIKLGKVYGNLMVDLMAVNDKLVDRGTRIIEQLTDLDYDGAQLKLFEAEKSVKTAIVMEKLNCTLNEAREKLENASGFLRNLID